MLTGVIVSDLILPLPFSRNHVQLGKSKKPFRKDHRLELHCHHSSPRKAVYDARDSFALSNCVSSSDSGVLANGEDYQ